MPEFFTNLCPWCGYDRRGNAAAAKCPECAGDCSTMRFTVKGADLRASSRWLIRLRNAAVATTILLVLCRWIVLSVASAAVAITLGLRIGRASRTASIMAVMMNGIGVSRVDGNMDTIPWEMLEQIRIEPARYETAAWLYRHLGETGRPWRIRARTRGARTPGVDFGILGSSDEIRSLSAAIAESADVPVETVGRDGFVIAVGRK